MFLIFLITEVTVEGVRLKSGKFISCGLVVWSGGVAPTEFVRNLQVKKNPLGQVCTRLGENQRHLLLDQIG